MYTIFKLIIKNNEKIFKIIIFNQNKYERKRGKRKFK